MKQLLVLVVSLAVLSCIAALWRCRADRGPQVLVVLREPPVCGFYPISDSVEFAENGASRTGAYANIKGGGTVRVEFYSGVARVESSVDAMVFSATQERVLHVPAGSYVELDSD